MAFWVPVPLSGPPPPPPPPLTVGPVLRTPANPSSGTQSPLAPSSSGRFPASSASRNPGGLPQASSSRPQDYEATNQDWLAQGACAAVPEDEGSGVSSSEDDDDARNSDLDAEMERIAALEGLWELPPAPAGRGGAASSQSATISPDDEMRMRGVPPRWSRWARSLEVEDPSSSTRPPGTCPGNCRPCSYFTRRGTCVKGDRCDFCHLCDSTAMEKLRKKQYKSALKRRKRQEGTIPKRGTRGRKNKKLALDENGQPVEVLAGEQVPDSSTFQGYEFIGTGFGTG